MSLLPLLLLCVTLKFLRQNSHLLDKNEARVRGRHSESSPKALLDERGGVDIVEEAFVVLWLWNGFWGVEKFDSREQSQLLDR